MSDRVVLRYFPILGRVQPLRHALLDAGVPFEDLRVPQSSWAASKDDPAVGGPLGSLPTLSWGDATVGEALAIASFLARRLGRRDGLDLAVAARLDAVCSAVYLDVTLRFADVLYADLLFPGADPVRALPFTAARAVDKLGRVDAMLDEGAFLGGPSPDVADFFAAEGFETTLYFLGAAREPAIRARLPRLAALADRLRAHPGLAGAWASRPATFTVRPDEPAIVDRLRAADLSSVGL